jgi:hypothetical protein
LIVCDDSSPVAREKYYPLLEQISTHNELLYVGPRQKEQFLAYLSRRLRDKRLDGLVKNLFRPSYGGNRNYTLMYTLGGLMVSSDDDMRPYALRVPRLDRGLCRKSFEDRFAAARMARDYEAVYRRLVAGDEPRARQRSGAAECDQPQLPAFVPELRVINLEVGSAVLDLRLVRHGGDVGVDVLRRTGEVSVVVAK